jgi:2-dehydropantoate 2-reductase
MPAEASGTAVRPCTVHAQQALHATEKSSMKICIVGAGAIGGFIGTRLAAAGRHQVSALARGSTLEALQTQGWRLRQDGQLVQLSARASGDAAELGAQDLLVIAVKGQSLPALAPRLAPLLTPSTRILPAMNGVPWWFVGGLPGLAEQPLASVDPGGLIAAALPFEQLLGCVVHASTACPEPGLVVHRMGRGLIVGEPRGGLSTRAAEVCEALTQAGFEVTHSTDIRRDIWYKLWGNLTMNPISALTGATIDQVLADPLLRDFCTRAMLEAAEIGARIGCPIDQSPEDRHAITARLGAFRTSMLQDVEAGRAIELDAIVGAVHELAQRCGVPDPSVAALMGLTRLFARQRGLYPGAASPA